MKYWKCAFFSFCCSGLMLQAQSPGSEDILVLESYQAEGVPRVAGGNVQLARARVSPASTFKVIIGWAGIDQGLVTAASELEVGDRHIEGTPRKINLHQAMVWSSNDYFIELARMIGKEKLTGYVRRSGMFPDEVPDDWLGEAWRPVIKGGELQTTPMHNHLFMRRLVFGKLIGNKDTLKELEKVMEWPNDHPMTRLYGKTGVWGGAVWFNGFGTKQLNTKVRTVFVRGGIEQRNRAIQTFYGGWALPYKPGMEKQDL